MGREDDIGDGEREQVSHLEVEVEGGHVEAIGMLKVNVRNWTRIG